MLGHTDSYSQSTSDSLYLLSPRDQIKYFKISVVWDSQPVTSFTFFMYVELGINQLCKYIPERNQNLEIICIFVYGCE